MGPVYRPAKRRTSTPQRVHAPIEEGTGLRGLAIIEDSFVRQRGALFGWVPVCMALGIGGYFAVPEEPSWMIYAAAAGIGGATGAGAWIFGRRLRARGTGAAGAALCMAALLICVGLCLAGLRAHRLAAPVIDWRYYGPIEGRIAGMDRASSGTLRLTLADLHLRNLAPDKTPRLVRLSLHGPAPDFAPQVGQVVMATGHLSAAPGPTEPSGFDFRRHAWFRQLGAVGYSRKPLVLLAPAQGWQGVTAARLALSSRVQAGMQGEAGAFAAAIMTGDRSAMDARVLADLRRSNLAHLLAISGLHMGLLAGVLFGAARLILCLVPWCALRLPVKKLAAVCALAGSAGYLLLSGGNIATERAFVMVAVALVAVICERRALSLRALALAAVIILALRPEGLTEPGFQMSFAATTGLVAVFGMLRGEGATAAVLPRWLYAPLAVLISSAVAGVATAPFSAAHFNQISHFGLLANLASVPLMGALVMPAAVAAAALMPLGLEAPALWVMGLGLKWILFVAHWVSGMHGAVGKVPAPPDTVLPLLAFGALVMVLWQGRGRWSGIAVMVLAFTIWAAALRPAVLIARDGALVGVRAEAGLVLSRAAVASFTAQNWLENDGDARSQETAASAWRGQGMMAGGLRIIHLQGKRAVEAFSGCAVGEIVVMNRDPQGRGRAFVLPADGTHLTARSACLILTPKTLARSGAIAFYEEADGLRLQTAQGQTGNRIWSSAAQADYADKKRKPLPQNNKGPRIAGLNSSSDRPVGRMHAGQ